MFVCTGDECSVQDDDRPLVLALQECGNIRFVLKVYQKGTDSSATNSSSPAEQKSKMSQSNKFFSAMKKKINKSKSKEQVGFIGVEGGLVPCASLTPSLTPSLTRS